MRFGREFEVDNEVKKIIKAAGGTRSFVTDRCCEEAIKFVGLPNFI